MQLSQCSFKEKLYWKQAQIWFYQGFTSENNDFYTHVALETRFENNVKV